MYYFGPPPPPHQNHREFVLLNPLLSRKSTLNKTIADSIPKMSLAYEPKGRGFESLQARGYKVRICPAKSGLFYALQLDFLGLYLILLILIHSDTTGYLFTYDRWYLVFGAE